jgi:hypothetical protein
MGTIGAYLIIKLFSLILHKSTQVPKMTKDEKSQFLIQDVHKI